MAPVSLANCTPEMLVKEAWSGEQLMTHQKWTKLRWQAGQPTTKGTTFWVCIHTCTGGEVQGGVQCIHTHTQEVQGGGYMICTRDKLSKVNSYLPPEVWKAGREWDRFPPVIRSGRGGRAGRRAGRRAGKQADKAPPRPAPHSHCLRC